MIINSVNIKKFRGFDDVSFQLGTALTVIAGQNGTQKTTLLGMLSQPFSISDKEHPMYGEKPLSGGNYRSSFADKFKLSEVFDTARNHEWTLNVNGIADPNFTVESIARSSTDATIRFWQKGTRAKGSGYIQLPVIYLSLSRLFPIGEDNLISSTGEITLSATEFSFFKEFHNKILLTPANALTSVEYLSSKQKNTLGVNTASYDWKMNSAGQDNVGKILLSIISFQRLKAQYGTEYKGGILAIDELDTTLYPASQIKLIEALRKFSSHLKIQIIFTTHSLNILERSCEWQSDIKINNQVKVLYLQKVDEKVKLVQDITFERIKHKLNISMAAKPVTYLVPVFTEDKECEIFFRAILKRKAAALRFHDCTLGCDSLIELVRKKIPGFGNPESLVVLDGDVKTDISKMRRLAGMKKSFIILPGINSPERLIAKFLFDLPDVSPIWDEISEDYTKQFVFKEYTIDEIYNDRIKAKSWFNEQKVYWGKLCSKVINPWITQNQSEVNLFLGEYETLILNYIK
ncbi:AAA family ATPase [Flavobacterium sp. NPDC079362]|uniref:AAA family ATPase n=1 Tax=Flavobacterium sp. NPDC079362 TaxID=3390566 RepID=UPI003D0534EA